MDNSPANGDVDLDTGYKHLDAFSSRNDAQNLEDAVRVVMRLDLDLMGSSEKLSSLHLLLMHLLAWNDDLDGNAIDDNFPEEFIEKALEFEYLCVILDSEVREVDNFLDILPAEIVDAQHKISSCRRFTEVCVVMEEKLRKCEESLKQSQIQVSEVKLQVAKMLRNWIENWEKDRNSSEDSYLNLKQNLRTSQLPKYALRMLQKSLARELALEKKLIESRQTEVDLKTKLHYTEQVAFHMEEAAEVVWGRFLEAENAAEVLMGISKDLAGRLQVVQFNLNSFAQNEAALKSQIEDCFEQMKQKDILLKELQGITADYRTKSFEVLTLLDKVKMLGEKLKESNAELENAHGSCEAYEQQLHEMESFVDSLKENIDAAENRADDAEHRAAQLTETNAELTEELNFIKSSLTSKSEKLTVLEKQLREADMHLQHARVSSEAGQEQQNMLYSAIWDMETLIEDLKSKASKAENRAVTAEEQCIVLSGSNAELNEELSALRGKIEKLETCLDEVNSSKNAGAEEIQLRTKVVMDMVVQLAYERERIQKQLCSLVAEKAYLMEKLREAKGYSFTGNNENRVEIEASTNCNVPSGNALSEDGLLPSTPI